MKQLLAVSAALAIMCAATHSGANARSLRGVLPQGGNAGIAGTVVDDRGRPVSHAAILVEDEDYVTHTYADGAGTFGFRGLIPGAFTVTARKAGLTTAAVGQRDPFGPASVVRIAAGQNVVVRVVMPRTGAITGTITSRGRPVSIAVEATRRSWRPIDPIEPFQLRGFSNARGEFRIANLPPGDYTVLLMPPRPWSIIRPPEGATDGRSAWVPTYFGGGWDAQSSPPVTIRPGEERTGFDFDVAPMPLSRVEVVVDAPAGVDPASMVPAIVRLGEYGYLLKDLPAAPQWLADRFVFDDVPPGRYVLDIGMPKVATQPFQCGSKQVTVVGGRLTAAVSLVPDVPLRGSVSVEAYGGSMPRLGAYESWVRLELVNGPCELEPVKIGTGPNTDFRISGVPAGAYVIHANDLPGWFVRAVSIDGKDVLDAITEIPQEGISNVVVHVTRRPPATVTGRLFDAAGRPSPEGRVVLFAIDRRTPDTDVQRTRLAVADSNGAFEINGLHAGEYAIATTDAVSLDEIDHAFMTRIEPSATRIVVGQGDVTRVELRQARGPVAGRRQ